MTAETPEEALGASLASVELCLYLAPGTDSTPGGGRAGQILLTISSLLTHQKVADFNMK